MRDIEMTCNEQTHNAPVPYPAIHHFVTEIWNLKFVPRGPINNVPALVQLMAWYRPGGKPLSEPMMIILLTHICVCRRAAMLWHSFLQFQCISTKLFLSFQPSDYEKMEKADIMEMTVSFLAKMTRAQQSRHVMLPSTYQMPRDINAYPARELQYDMNNNHCHVPRHLVQPAPQSPGLLLATPVAGLPHNPMTSPICASSSTSPVTTDTCVWRPW